MHIDDLAELYALGVLDDAERAAVDAHLQTCVQCAQRVGEAEMIIADTIAEREPPPSLDRRMHAALAPRRTSSTRWGVLVAAAFVLGLLPGVLFGMFANRPSGFDRDRDRAIAAMVNSHFLHAQFIPLTRDAPKAKVLYGRGKAWRFFVAQTMHAYVVESEDNGQRTVLGTLHVSGNAAELFVDNANARSFVLLDGARPIARVRLP
jgi:hypothetical protein